VRLDLVVDVPRLEERLIRRELAEWASVETVNLRREPLPYGGLEADAAVIRPISMYQAAYAAAAYEASGATAVNTSQTIILAGDKALTYARLAAAGLPTPMTVLAATPEAALGAAEKLGYPLVLKSPVGSWGRLVARARSREKLSQLAELRAALPCTPQRTMLIQPLLDTNGADIRCVVVAGELLGCIKRTAAKKGEWRSNVALGAAVEPHSPDGELEELMLRAAEAVKGFFVSIDVFETRQGYLVNEVNGVPEFKGFMKATGRNPAKALSKALHNLLKK